MECFSLMLSGRTFQREEATYLKARWPYRFVLESLGPGASRRDLDADLRRVVFLEKIREVEGGVIMRILWQIRFWMGSQ